MGFGDAIAGSVIRIGANRTSTRNGERRLLVLAYHRVARSVDACMLGATDSQSFSRQMKIVSECFRPLPLAEAAERLRTRSLPRRAICVTFDDGYADNLNIALPILKQYGIPATVFVATGYVDGGRMWNDTIFESVRRAKGELLELPAIDFPPLSIRNLEERGGSAKKLVLHLRRMQPELRQRYTDEIANSIGAELPTDLMLTTSQIVALHNEGIEIGAHTVSHPVLSRLTDDAAIAEIRQSRSHLQEITGSEVCGFAYPNGRPGVDYGKVHVEAVAKCGFAYAVSTAQGTSSASTDRFQLPRLGPWDESPLKFGLRLATEYASDPGSTV